METEYSQVAVDVPIEALEILPNIPDVRWIDETLARKDRKDVWNNIDKDKLTTDVISQFEEMLKERGRIMEEINYADMNCWDKP